MTGPGKLLAGIHLMRNSVKCCIRNLNLPSGVRIQYLLDLAGNIYQIRIAFSAQRYLFGNDFHVFSISYFAEKWK